VEKGHHSGTIIISSQIRRNEFFLDLILSQSVNLYCVGIGDLSPHLMGLPSGLNSGVVV
jgi:hypothetical protein